MRKLLVLLSLFILSTSQLFATDVSSLTSIWGGATLNTCENHGYEGSEACIGQSVRTACATWKNRGFSKHGFSILMMIAKTVTDKGAYFCPMQVESDNGWYDAWAWTMYGDTTNGTDSNCVWLCRDGYTGATCSEPASSAKSCDSTPLLRENYANIQVRTYSDIDDSVAKFASQYKMCYGTNAIRGQQEHDMVLGISRWLPNGHGAFVRQMVVWTDIQRSIVRDSTASIYPAQNGKEILVCKNGYKPNANGDNCEPINRELCPESIEDMRAALCTGWTDMDENIHDFKLDATKNCYQFRCINNKEAFVSGADRTCAECVTSPRNGVSPVNGVCIRCDKGKIFDANAKSSGYCTDTTGYTKTDMMYGKGKTKNSVQNIDDQCWPLITPDEYKECVTGQSNASSDTIIRTNSQQLR